MEKMRVVKKGNGLIIGFTEEISLSLASMARDSIVKEMESPEVQAVLFDLATIAALNSMGIGLMVATKTNCTKAGKKFYLLSPSEAVLRTLDVVKMRNFFEVVEDTDSLEH